MNPFLAILTLFTFGLGSIGVMAQGGRPLGGPQGDEGPGGIERPDIERPDEEVLERDRPDEAIEEDEPLDEPDIIEEGEGEGEGGGRGAVECLAEDIIGPPGTLIEILSDVDHIRAAECFGWDNALNLNDYRNWQRFQKRWKWDPMRRIQYRFDPLTDGFARTQYLYDGYSRFHEIVRQIEGAKREFAGIPTEEFDFRETMTYDGVGYLETRSLSPVENPENSIVTHFKRTADDDISSIRGPEGMGYCLGERDNAGRPRQMRFDGVSDLGECHVDQGSIRYDYEENSGRLRTVRLADGTGTEILERNAFGQPKRVGIAGGRELHYIYNPAGLLINFQLYNSEGRVTASVETGYDNLGRVVRKSELIIPTGGTGPLNLNKISTRTMHYDYIEEDGQSTLRIRFPGARGQELVKTHIMDGLDRLLRREQPETPALVLRYLDNSNQVEIWKQGHANFKAVIKNDRRGLPVQSLLPTGLEIHRTYDSENVLTELQTGFLNYHHTSDLLGRLSRIRRVRPLNAQGFPQHVDEATIEYVGQSNKIGSLVGPHEMQTEPRPGAWRMEYEYGPQKWLSKKIDPDNHETQFINYNDRGLLIAFRDGRGTHFSLDWDVTGNLGGITAETADGLIFNRRMEYDDNGHLRWIAESRGGNPPIKGGWYLAKKWSSLNLNNPVEVFLDVDSAGRLTQERLRLEKQYYTTQTRFSPLNTVNEYTNPSGLFVEYGRTNAGHLLETNAKKSRGGRTLWHQNYVYDPEQGQYTSVQHRGGHTTQLFYDDFGRSVAWSRTDRDGDVAYEELRFDPAGKVIARAREINNVPEGEGREHWTVAYDAAERFVSATPTDRGGFNAVSRNTWVHDVDPARIFDNQCVAGRTCIHYNSNQFPSDLFEGREHYRLTTRSDGSLEEAFYHLDCDSLEDGIGGSCNDPQLYHDTYVRDENSNRRSRVRADGDPQEQYFYDVWNRLIDVVLPGGNVRISYRYDGLDRLVQRVVSEKRRVWGGRERFQFTVGQLFLYQGARLVEIREVRPNPRRWWWWATVTHTKNFIYDVRNKVAAVIYDRGKYEEHIRGLDGSLLGILDSWQDLEAVYRYSPLGRDRRIEVEGGGGLDANGAEENHLKYRGLWQDPLTGLYNIGGRWYLPKEGRFLTRDPTGVSLFNFDLFQFAGYDYMSP